MAIKIFMDIFQGMSYKLRMMEVIISSLSYIYGDNMSVIHHSQPPESTLKNKSNYIFYHGIRKSVAIGESLTGHVGTNKNCADLATKVLNGGKRRFHVSNLLYKMYNDL